jgi:hypothetical protein
MVADSHPERTTAFTNPANGSVPTYRTTGPSLVVCKPNSAALLAASYGVSLKRSSHRKVTHKKKARRKTHHRKTTHHTSPRGVISSAGGSAEYRDHRRPERLPDPDHARRLSGAAQPRRPVWRPGSAPLR